jgi:hypothetical protein
MEENINKKENIIKEIEKLTLEPGFIYSLAMVLRHDLFLDPEEAVDINWRERLSFREISFLVGLLVKHEINLQIFPTEDAAKKQINAVHDLFDKLHAAHNQPFFKKLTEKIKAVKTKEDADKKSAEFFGDGELMIEPIFYGGSGAYDFQFLEFAEKKYSEDDEWIKKNKGISISTIVKIAFSLKKINERKSVNFPKVDKFEDFCKEILGIFCFSSEDLNSFDKEAVKSFISAFSVVPGKANFGFGSIGAYNEVESKPIIILGDDFYFLPGGFDLTQSIYESPFYWMKDDIHYKDLAFEHRGNSTEELATQMLASVFGEANVFRDVKVYRNKKDLISDIDVLVVAGNKAIVLQSKSKKLTELSKRGDDKKLRQDFNEAIQKAYEQGLACRSAILDRRNTLFADGGGELKLSESIDDVYIICLTTDHYPAMVHQTDVYLKKDSKDPFPLTMSIFDLDVLAFYLKDPFDFLYYLRQRVNLSTYYKASSEVVFLACHLKQKLFPRPGIDYEALDDSFAQLIDANFPAMCGYYPKTKAMERLHHNWKNEKFNQLVAQVKTAKETGFTDALFFLYDLAGSGADDLIKIIEQVKAKTLSDNKMHDFTMIFEKGKCGLTFVSHPDSPVKLEQNLMTLAVSRKYKTKADVWLALGSVAGSPNIIDAIAFNKEPWREDKKLEELSKVALKPGTLISLHPKIGRNDPCYCGSGRKYKKCCGRQE